MPAWSYCDSYNSALSRDNFYYFNQKIGGKSEVLYNEEHENLNVSWRFWPHCVLAILTNDFSRNFYGMEIAVCNTEKSGFENSLCHKQFSNLFFSIFGMHDN